MKRISPIFGALAALAVSAAYADERSVRRLLEPRINDAKIESVSKTGVPGLYEVALRRADGPAVFYTDESGRYVLVGSLIDATSDRNLTAERMRALSAIDWASLPFKWAISWKRGAGGREIAIFSDPNCPFCKRFEGDLAKLDDITVHIFPYPVIKPESVRQTKAVWCSRDRVKAWNELMHKRVEPPAKPDCDTPIEELVALGRRLGANSTPTWFLRSGEKYSGAMKMTELVPLLDAARPK